MLITDQNRNVILSSISGISKKVSNLMNLFLTGEFKQCKTGKRVLEDYLKNYNQFNQGLGLNSDSVRL